MEPKELYRCITSFLPKAIWVLFLFHGNLIFSQDQSFVVPDSLQHLGYKELYSSYVKTWPDTLVSKIYLNTYLKKAVLDNDPIKKAKAYCLLSYYAVEESKKIELLDRSIALSAGLGDKVYPIEAYSFKGGYYLKKGNIAAALDNYLKILPIAEQVDNQEYLYITRHNIARIKTEIGKHDEALPLFKENFIHNSSKPKINTTRYLKSSIKLGESYRYNNKLDSASIINHKALQKLEGSEYHYNRFYGKIMINEGITLFYKKNYIQAQDTITQGIRQLDKQNDENKNVYILGEFHLGKLARIQNNYKKATYHFLTVDSIFEKEHKAPLEVREGYEFLLKFAKNNNNKEDQLKYINKLIVFDSITNSEASFISSRLFKDFDTPILLQEKEKLINELKGTNKNLNVLVLSLGIITLIITIFLYRQYQKKKTYREKFEQLIASENTKETQTPSASPLDIGVTEEIISEILDKLKSFEEKQLFLKKNISVTSLAKDIKTNTKYLSKVINHYKQKNFANYINDLRIQYAVEKLKTDKTLKHYTIQSIAEEMGFNTAESFSSAFKKTTGIKTTYFLKKLNDLNTD
ncbi:helix-turn-helix domain-containing protein [Aquimarina sp. D1M17]|uniref:AraC family transcriptional regulator n=1 Tax=Aquimarina acroporae TaxID=2937283 RepID=UPI0020C011C4|nr:AraC family transcriptional regulator [Aquimarina acroporae]MCK8523625.1 helix-turn-helix domain-containing protein [Aquimarina acroporae]